MEGNTENRRFLDFMGKSPNSRRKTPASEGIRGRFGLDSHVEPTPTTHTTEWMRGGSGRSQTQTEPDRCGGGGVAGLANALESVRSPNRKKPRYLQCFVRSESIRVAHRIVCADRIQGEARTGLGAAWTGPQGRIPGRIEPESGSNRAQIGVKSARFAP